MVGIFLDNHSNEFFEHKSLPGHDRLLRGVFILEGAREYFFADLSHK